MQPSQITEVLHRPTSQELLARDVTRLAYVAFVVRAGPDEGTSELAAAMAGFGECG